jgi:dipeptidyl aminopeptidase/acylaminoacyl peptidase
MKKYLFLLIICFLAIITVSAQTERLIAFLRWSPDGTQISYWMDGDIWLMNADGSNPRNMTDIIAAPVNPAQWSADGAYLTFWYNSHLWWLNVSDTSLNGLTFTLAETPSDAVISPVENSIAYSTQNSIYRQQIPTGEPQLLASNLPNAQQILAGTLRWSPDGQSLAFLTLSNDSAADGSALRDLWLMNADASNLRQLQTTHSPQIFKWIDNNYLMLSANTGFGDPGALLSYTGISQAENTLDYLNANQLTTSFDAATYSLSPNGQFLAYTNYDLAELDQDGTSIEASYTIGAEIFILDIATRQQLAIPPTETIAFNTALAIFWLNDSNFVFLNQCEAGIQSLWLMSLAGEGREILACRAGLIGDLVLSPDGGQIALVAQWDGTRNIYVLNIADSNLRNLTAP